MMKIPNANKISENLLRSVLPEDQQQRIIKVLPMFGNLAAFANGNLFTAVFGGPLFAHLSASDAENSLKAPGATLFAPMRGGGS